MSGYKIDEVISLLYQINIRLKRIEDQMGMDEQELEDILKDLEEELNRPAPKKPKLTVVKDDKDDNVFEFIPR